ncbi:sorbitol dehydrogenase-like [Haliotis rubra]|uniref:sorbitol dehydrogenase-like n=1 Tax=Haliotis rubra TaxID=36100 RepID=UPI001EE61E40|nr:sorbitol dehydrogenase-like [Haliotis rubra]
MAKSGSNLTAVLDGANDLRMIDAPIPEPKYGEVQLKLLNCGICGTDVHIWKHGGFGGMPLTDRIVMGHESSSVITKVGEGVTHLKVGDRVATEPGGPCFQCKKCKAGRYNLCPVMQVIIPKYCGNLTRYAIHGADLCFKLPDNISDEEGAIIEPLAVTVYACKRANIGMGDTVLICGSGSIGLLCLVTVLARGATTVLVTDIADEKLKVAKQAGATYTLNVRGMSPKEAAAAIEDVLGGPADVSMECTGVPSCVSTAIYATTRGGNVTMVGMGDLVQEVPLGTAAMKEVDIRGILRYCHDDFSTAVSLVASGKVNVKPLITHRFPLEKTLEALQTTASGVAVKVMVRCAEN